MARWLIFGSSETKRVEEYDELNVERVRYSSHLSAKMILDLSITFSTIIFSSSCRCSLERAGMMFPPPTDILELPCVGKIKGMKPTTIDETIVVSIPSR